MIHFFFPVNPPWDIELRRGGTTGFAVRPRNFPWSRLFSALYLRGGGGGGWGGGGESELLISQLRPLATRTPSLGRCGQGALEFCLPQIRKCHFLRLFIYHFKAHTISNKLVSKVFAQKKGRESYDSYKYVFQFRWFQVQYPLKTI